MIWATIIMGALSMLLQWLLSMKKSGGMLGDRQRQRLNNLIYRCRQAEAAGVELGCKAGGEPEPAQAEPVDSIELVDALARLGREIDS